MGLVIVIVVIAAVIVGAIAIVLLKRRPPAGGGAETPNVPAPRPDVDEPPMNGLESALDQITDRDGRTMRDRLDDEQGIVDDLRVPDDTGPLLRRALDEFADDTAANERPRPDTGAETSD